MTLPANALSSLKRRAARARKPSVICPASRRLHLMADDLARGKWPMLWVEPQHAAESIYSVLEALWKARAELARMKGKR